MLRQTSSHAPFAFAVSPLDISYYAFADVHGYADAFERLLHQIHEHRLRNPARKVRIVGVGDYVNRGPDSRGVMDLLEREIRTAAPGVEWVLLRGNHDVGLLYLLRARLKPDEEIPATIRSLIDKGGIPTLHSYGVDLHPAPSGKARHIHTVAGTDLWVGPEQIIRAQQELLRVIPHAHLRILTGLRSYYETRRFFFVHAGVDPERSLSRQFERVMLGTDESVRGFVKYDRKLDKIIVHGHTPTDQPVHNPAQISIDTGVYKTGRLTGVALSGETPVFMTAMTDLPRYDKKAALREPQAALA